MENNENLIDIIRAYNNLRDSLSDYAEVLLEVYPNAEDTKLDAAFGDLFGSIRCLGITLSCAGNAIPDGYSYCTNDSWYVYLHDQETGDDIFPEFEDED